MDIDGFQEAELINSKLMQIVSHVSKSEPATSAGFITHYHKETQEAHRNRHVFFTGHEDEHMHHGLYQGHHADHEFHDLLHVIQPSKGIFERVEHEQVFGGGVEVKGTKKDSHGHGGGHH